jgi:excisionase family DNA binding protein
MITVNITDNGKIEGYLTVTEFAELNNLQPGTVRQWINRGHIKALKIIGSKGNVVAFIKKGEEVRLSHGHKGMVRYE